MSLRKNLALLGAAGVLVVGAAACGSSSSSSSSPSSSGSGSSSVTAGSSATGAQLKIGYICSCTGPFGTNIAAAGDVAKAWAKSVNAAGGVDGHPVDLIFEDDGSTPGTSVTDVQQLISDHVSVILDDTVLDVTWQKAVDAAKIPVVGGNFSSEPFYTDANWFPSGQTNDSITYSNIAVAKMAGANNIANFYCAESVQCQQSVAPMKTVGQQLGVPQKYSASISMTAPNYTAQCVAASQAKISAVFIGDSSSVIENVANDCSQQGFNPYYVTEGTGFSLQLASKPGLKDKLWSDYPVLPFWDKTPQTQQLNALVDKYNPGLRNNQLAWTEYAAQTYTGFLLIEDALKGSGISASTAPTNTTMTKGLDSIKGDTLGGWSPPLTFNTSTHKVDCWFVGHIVNGTPTMANNGKQSCESGSAAS